MANELKSVDLMWWLRLRHACPPAQLWVKSMSITGLSAEEMYDRLLTMQEVYDWLIWLYGEIDYHNPVYDLHYETYLRWLITRESANAVQAAVYIREKYGHLLPAPWSEIEPLLAAAINEKKQLWRLE